MSIRAGPVCQIGTGRLMRQGVRKILIVNREAAYADFLRVNIEKAFPSLRITVTESGESALSLLGKRPYDLVITDTVLAGMGGMNLFFELKRQYPLLKTILLSDCFDTKEAKLLQKEGLFGFIEKPFLMESLAELIERAVRE
jgi:two-component system response regulator AtoC